MKYLILLLFPIHAWAWAEHHALTRHALKSLPDLSAQTVEVTSFNELLQSMGIDDPKAFNTLLQIRKDYNFSFKADEKPGNQMSSVEVLSIYSDEPDWEMDTELFSEGQYPELWKGHYKMMGGRHGTPSQAFRHMYWPPFTLLHPLVSFKLPLDKFFGSMGEAPERAARFVELARKSMQLKQRYWGLRFLANALHYIEDVSSPFHSTQTPTKKFISMPLTKEQGSGWRQYVHQVRQIISYYHFAFEDYIGHILVSDDLSQRPRRLLLDALSRTEVSHYDGDVEDLVRVIAKRSMTLSAQAAQSSILFFPPIDEAYVTFKPKEKMDSDWWKKVYSSSDLKVQEGYFQIVSEMFRPLGAWVRAFVLYETNQNNLIRVLAGGEGIELPSGKDRQIDPKAKQKK